MRNEFSGFPRSLPGFLSIARVLRCQGRRGTAALEFALITPAFLLMILAMTCFGLYLTYVQEIEELAASAARSSVAGLSETERNSMAEQFVANAVASSGFINPADITVRTQTSGTPATDYSVTVTYSLSTTPIPLLASLISMPMSTITRTATIEFGGY